MPEITYTLLSDGTSDRALLPIIDWTLRQHFPDLLVQRQWADFSLLPEPPPNGKLSERIQRAIDLYPCDWLFIHRDAERQPITDRHQEIAEAWENARIRSENNHFAAIVPVRMTEAWLLFDEQAIRTAAGNPSGKQPIVIPSLRTLETLPDPKQVLQRLLREASGLNPRQLRRFNVSRAVQLVADNVQDYSPLRSLAAFTMFDESIRTSMNVYL